MKINTLVLFFSLAIGQFSNAQVVTDSSRVVKVLSFNILHGATTRDDFNLDLIAQVIIDADPDFVAMQEVDFKTNRARKYDLVTELGWRTKLVPLFGRSIRELTHPINLF